MNTRYWFNGNPMQPLDLIDNFVERFDLLARMAYLVVDVGDMRDQLESELPMDGSTARAILQLSLDLKQLREGTDAWMSHQEATTKRGASA